MKLTITYEGEQGTATYTVTYKFSRPAVPFGTRMKIAGYMGDFILHPNGGSITELPNRYTHQ